LIEPTFVPSTFASPVACCLRLQPRSLVLRSMKIWKNLEPICVFRRGWNPSAHGSKKFSPRSTPHGNNELREAHSSAAFDRPRATLRCSTFDGAGGVIARQHLLKRAIEICVKRITPLRVCRKVATVLVHPEPWRGILAHVRLE